MAPRRDLKTKIARRVAVALLLPGLLSTAQAQTIKLATFAPEGSSWMTAMRAGASEISGRTDGRVSFKFYGGGVQGNDKQVLRKMRIGQLHGGAFTSNALVELQKDAALYAMPMMFRDAGEVKFARERMDDKLRALMEQAGYVNFGFAGGGFAHMMSVRPIARLADLQGLKVWIPDGDEISYAAISALGVTPVTMPLTDVLTGLQTELIDTIMGPPAATIILQWNTSVSHITELPLSYIVAMLVVDRKYFEKLLPADQLVVREVMEEVYRGFDQQSVGDNDKAYRALLDDGMQQVAPDPGEVPEWQRVVRASNHRLSERGLVDRALLDELECYITAYRNADSGEDCAR